MNFQYKYFFFTASVDPAKISPQTICKGFLDETSTFMTTQAEIFMRNYSNIFQLSQTALRFYFYTHYCI